MLTSLCLSLTQVIQRVRSPSGLASNQYLALFGQGVNVTSELVTGRGREPLCVNEGARHSNVRLCGHPKYTLFFVRVTYSYREGGHNIVVQR